MHSWKIKFNTFHMFQMITCLIQIFVLIVQAECQKTTQIPCKKLTQKYNALETNCGSIFQQN